ncbi:MAG: 1-acyl-sn-glycerol-3-phosphate acyltransferase [Actinomycetota bacterium]|nr:1-acyl-sn-glycerol-3-phosphate acyltransferase [Actinomycetota bacterium]MDQ2959270.1 1-acyl-sn-glycerol-3-phosphate acyltransferase [Actinomycetota bacterium]
MTAGLPPRPIRRVVLDPIFVPVALLLIVLFWSVAALAWLLGLLARRKRGRVWRLAALAGIYLSLDLVMLLGCFGLWLRSPWPAGHGPGKWRAAHVALLRWTLGRLMTASRKLLGFTVELENPELRQQIWPAGQPEPPPVLVLARHAGPGDSFTLVHLIASTLDRCPRVVLKAALQWDPGLDVLLNRLSCCFLPSATGAGEDRTGQLGELAADLHSRDALLLFPEGGNWTPHRHRRAVRRLWRAGRTKAARRAEADRHVLPPRPGGTLACLAARPDADVLVIAHTGLDTLVSPALMWRALPLSERPMTIGWWHVPGLAVPIDEAGRTEWLAQQWHRVDEWVAERGSMSR